LVEAVRSQRGGKDLSKVVQVKIHKYILRVNWAFLKGSQWNLKVEGRKQDCIVNGFDCNVAGLYVLGTILLMWVAHWFTKGVSPWYQIPGVPR
jgi:hypothetical protein